MELDEEERLKNCERWNDWADKAVEGGAKIAHAATKEAKQAAVPGASCEGSMTGCPAEVLISEVASYAVLWGADPSGRKLKNVEDAAMKELGDILSNTEPPKKLTGKELRNAAKTFKICTMRPDGIHPKHIAYLSDPAVEALADLLNLVEVTGEFPDEMCDVIVALFDKPEGGTRPIGWCRAIVRVWASARKHLWQEWERSSGEKNIFGAGEGRTVTDIVWRQSARVGITGMCSKIAGAVLEDLKKCYEYVRHLKLIKEGIRLQYPLHMSRLAVKSYEWKRHVAHSGLLHHGVFPTRGIIAGFASATTDLKVYMYTALTGLIYRHPEVDLDVYIDDVTLEAHQDTVEGLVHVLGEAANDFRETMRNELGLEVGVPKRRWYPRAR